MYFAVVPHFPMHAIALISAVNQMELCEFLSLKTMTVYEFLLDVVASLRCTEISSLSLKLHRKMRENCKVH